MQSDIFTFLLPDIGEGVVEGEVIEWLKKVGDTVKQDEPVVTVMTDKATVELPSPHPGVLEKQYHQPGEIAHKDQPLFDIRLSHPIEIKEERKISMKAAATPKVRHLAKEMEIDLEAVHGTGKEGRVTAQDLKAAVTEGDEIVPLSGVRGLMARRMDKTHIPQFSYFEHAETTRLIQMRANFKIKAENEGIHLSYMPFFIRALSLLARQYPIVNSTVDMEGNRVILHKRHHVGIAMATSHGLIVPVLKDVQEMGLEEVIHAYEEMKAKALADKLTSEEMKGATITISNFGVLGGEGLWATPLVTPPEVAILALARMRKIPAVKNETLVIRDVIPLSWSFDHRVIDGELAAIISHHYSTLVKDPAFLL